MKDLLRPAARRILLPLLALLASGLLAWSAAYQVPFTQMLSIGGDLERQRRHDDAPFFRAINSSEPADQLVDPTRPECAGEPTPTGLGCMIWWWELAERTGKRPYRWTSDETHFVLPGVGPGRYLIELHAVGAPGGTPVTWESNGGPRYTLSIPEGIPRRYYLLTGSGPNDELRLVMRATSFTDPSIDRELGFVLYALYTQALPAPWRLPAWPQLAWLALITTAIYLWALAAGSKLRGAVTLGLLALVSATYSLIFHRSALTLFTPLVASLCSLSASVTIGAAWFERRTGRMVAAVTALVMAAFTLRVAGMLHPHAIFSDTALQANKLFEASLGRIFLSAGLPSGAGGGMAPYPPALFILLIPFQLVGSEDHANRILLVQIGSALLDSLVVALLWFLLLRSGLGHRAALFAAALYLLPVAALESFSIGELANLGGQALAMPFLALLALGFASPHTDRPLRSLTLLTLALTIALVAHSGVTLSVGALVAVAWVMALASWLLRRPWPISPWRLGLVAAISLSSVLISYYSAPIYLERIMSGVDGGSMGRSVGAVVSETGLGLLGVIPPHARARSLPTLLSLSALAGLALLWVTPDHHVGRLRLRAILAAWWVATLLTQGLLLFAEQGLRWALFLYPALALTAGPLLAALWSRGRAGRLVAWLLLAAIVIFGLTQWILQLRDYIHV